MAQTDWDSGQSGPIEQPYGQYSVHRQGNSRTVTVPRATGLDAHTQISVRAGWYDEKLIYLKAVPLKATFQGLPGTETGLTTSDGARITEDEIDIFCVRGGDSECQYLTIPAKCETTEFPTGSEPMLVGGLVDGELSYIKLIPDSLFSATGSVVTDDLVHTITDDTC